MMAGMPTETALSPLVGRTDTVRALADAVGLGRDPGGKVLLGGDAGVGKSRLLAELTDLAQSEGWRVLVGHCLDFGDSALPYLPFTEAFGRLAADAPEAARSLVAGSAVLERLLPTHRILADPEGHAEPTDRAAMFDAVQQALAELATSTPLLLIVEDVHWADPSTRELLTFLLTRRTSEPVALVASYRSDDLNRRHPLRAVLAEWHRLSVISRIHVERLDESDIRSMIANLQPLPLPEREIQRIVARAEGNPFFAEELVAAAETADCTIPIELADLLLVRLERLDAHGRLAVRAASVAGRRVPHDLLARASGLRDGDLDLALRSAVEANVLLPTTGDRYMFRHALLAEAVYDDLLPGERVRLHAAYVRALNAHDVPGTAAELARHARAAHDLVTAARASVRAGEEAMAVGGPDEAARHYELALELLADPDVAAGVDAGDDGSEPIDRVDLATKACAAAVSAGHVFRALALAQDQQRALAPGASAADRVRMLLTVASTAILVDSRVDVLALTTEAVGLLPADAPDVLRAQILNIHARANADRARDDDASRWAGEALSMARELGRLDIAADAATTLARIEERVGDPDGSRLALVEAVAQARASGEVASELRGLFALGGLHYDLGRLPEALEVYQQAWKRAKQAGLPWGPYGLEARAMAAIVALVAGDWDLAARTADITGETPPRSPARPCSPPSGSRWPRAKGGWTSCSCCRRCDHGGNGTASSRSSAVPAPSSCSARRAISTPPSRSTTRSWRRCQRCGSASAVWAASGWTHCCSGIWPPLPRRRRPLSVRGSGPPRRRALAEATAQAAAERLSRRTRKMGPEARGLAGAFSRGACPAALALRCRPGPGRRPRGGVATRRSVRSSASVMPTRARARAHAWPPCSARPDGPPRPRPRCCSPGGGDPARVAAAHRRAACARRSRQPAPAARRLSVRRAADASRARGAGPGGPGPQQRRDRQASVHQHQDGQRPRLERDGEAGRRQPHRGGRGRPSAGCLLTAVASRLARVARHRPGWRQRPDWRSPGRPDPRRRESCGGEALTDARHDVGHVSGAAQRDRAAAEPATSHPGAESSGRHRRLDCQVELAAGHLEVRARGIGGRRSAGAADLVRARPRATQVDDLDDALTLGHYVTRSAS